MRLTTYLKNRDENAFAFSKRAGISPSTITRLERGEKWPERATWDRIVLATGWQVTPNDYLTATPPTASKTEAVNG